MLIGGGGNCFFGGFAGSMTGSIVGNAISQRRCCPREVTEVRVIERPVVQPVVVRHPTYPRSYTDSYQREPVRPSDQEELRKAKKEAKKAQQRAALLENELEEIKRRQAKTDASLAEYQDSLKKLQSKKIETPIPDSDTK